jgi:hypothetical protein
MSLRVFQHDTMMFTVFAQHSTAYACKCFHAQSRLFVPHTEWRKLCELLRHLFGNGSRLHLHIDFDSRLQWFVDKHPIAGISQTTT